MRVNRFLMTFLVLGMGLSCIDYLSAQDSNIPKDHPIHNRGPIVGRKLNIATRGLKNISFTFKPAKKEYFVGEPITGLLSVRVDKEMRGPVRLSPPYNGFHVSTLSVWRRKWNDTKQEWSELEEIIELNKGLYHKPRLLQYQGKPIVLKPGETYRVPVAINMPQLISGGPPPAHVTMLPSIGTDAPGRYQFYVKYLNLQELTKYKHRLMDREDLPPHQLRRVKPGETANLPLEPFVFGPIEVSVVKPKKGNADRWQKLIENLDQYAAHLRRDKNWGWMPGIRSKQMEKQDVTSLPDELAVPLILAHLRTKMAGWSRKRSRTGENVSERKINNVDNKLKTLFEKTTEQAIRDVITITRCHLYALVDKYEKALKLARELDSPDGPVFKDLGKHWQSNNNKK